MEAVLCGAPGRILLQFLGLAGGAALVSVEAANVQRLGPLVAAADWQVDAEASFGCHACIGGSRGVSPWTLRLGGLMSAGITALTLCADNVDVWTTLRHAVCLRQLTVHTRDTDTVEGAGILTPAHAAPVEALHLRRLTLVASAMTDPSILPLLDVARLPALKSVAVNPSTPRYAHRRVAAFVRPGGALRRLIDGSSDKVTLFLCISARDAQALRSDPAVDLHAATEGARGIIEHDVGCAVAKRDGDRVCAWLKHDGARWLDVLDRPEALKYADMVDNLLTRLSSTAWEPGSAATLAGMAARVYASPRLRQVAATLWVGHSSTPGWARLSASARCSMVVEWAMRHMRQPSRELCSADEMVAFASNVLDNATSVQGRAERAFAATSAAMSLLGPDRADEARRLFTPIVEAAVGARDMGLLGLALQAGGDGGGGAFLAAVRQNWVEGIVVLAQTTIPSAETMAESPDSLALGAALVNESPEVAARLVAAGVLDLNRCREEGGSSLLSDVLSRRDFRKDVAPLIQSGVSMLLGSPCALFTACRMANSPAIKAFLSCPAFAEERAEGLGVLSTVTDELGNLTLARSVIQRDLELVVQLHTAGVLDRADEAGRTALAQAQKRKLREYEAVLTA